MKAARKLALTKETLTEITTDELRQVLGGDAMTHRAGMSACGHACLTDEAVCLTIKTLCVATG